MVDERVIISAVTTFVSSALFVLTGINSRLVSNNQKNSLLTRLVNDSVKDEKGQYYIIYALAIVLLVAFVIVSAQVLVKKYNNLVVEKEKNEVIKKIVDEEKSMEKLDDLLYKDVYQNSLGKLFAINHKKKDEYDPDSDYAVGIIKGSYLFSNVNNNCFENKDKVKIRFFFKNPDHDHRVNFINEIDVAENQLVICFSFEEILRTISEDFLFVFRERYETDSNLRDKKANETVMNFVFDVFRHFLFCLKAFFGEDNISFYKNNSHEDILLKYKLLDKELSEAYLNDNEFYQSKFVDKINIENRERRIEILCYNFNNFDNADVLNNNIITYDKYNSIISEVFGVEKQQKEINDLISEKQRINKEVRNNTLKKELDHLTKSHPLFLYC